MAEPVIVATSRTPIGRASKGSLVDARPDDMSAFIVKDVLSKVDGLDPAEVDEDLRRLIGEEARLMPHLHLSVQHGDGLILKRMKRRHSPEDLIRLLDDLRQRRPDVVFGGDIIAGFPTEDNAAHRRSMELIEALDISWLHIFPY